jgi:biotin synthase
MTELTPRHDWTRAEIETLYEGPLDGLIGRALDVKRANWPDGKIQKSQLLSIKTGGCPEDCGYCSQSAHFDTGLDASKLMPLGDVVDAARRAKANGADRFCMGAAWRSLKDRDLPKVAAMIEAVKAEGLETCVTLGMLEAGQAEALAEAGLDYYNHNLDTSPEY